MGRRKQYLNQARADELRENAVMAEGFKIQVRDTDGTIYEEPDLEAFKKAIDEIVMGMPDATMATKAKKGRTYHSILTEILPNLKVDNVDMEEEDAYNRLLSMVSRRCSTAPSGPIQSQLMGRVLCNGTIVTKGGRNKGCWITSSASPTGPLAEAWDEEIAAWAKRVKSLGDYGRMVTNRVPDFSEHAVAALESHVAQVSAALDTFKRQALAAGSAPADDDLLDGEADEDAEDE